MQIVQRSGGSGGGQVKILGQSSSHRSRPPPESSHTGLGAVPEDSRHPDGQPAAPKKKQSFSMPVAAAAFSRCRLMDEEWRVCVDAVHPHLLESGSEFTVVACIGAQGAGKSTVLSLLLSSFQGLLGKTPGGDKAETPSANTGNSGLSPFEALAGDSSPEPDAGFEAPLDIHSQRSFLEGEASPAGVDLCVSSMDRLLLLDAQPLFACEALPEAELKSELYLLTFLVSICHTLLVVTDAPVDLQLWKLLRLLAMLKSKVPDLPTWVERQSEGGERQEQQFPLRESLPRLVIAFNNVKQGCDIPELYQPVQAFLEHTLWKGAPSTQCVQIPTLPGSSLSALLTSNVAYRAGMQLREKVLANGPERGRFGKDRLQLTEREWLYHVSGYWDFVQKVPIVQDYFSMLGQGLESYGWPKC